MKIFAALISMLIFIGCSEQTTSPEIIPIDECPEHTILELQQYLYGSQSGKGGTWQNTEDGRIFLYRVRFDTSGFFDFDSTVIHFEITRKEKCYYQYNLFENGSPVGEVFLRTDLKSDEIWFEGSLTNLLFGRWRRE